MAFTRKRSRILASVALGLVIVQSLENVRAQGSVPFDIQRPSAQTIRLNWLPVTGDRILQLNQSFDDPLGWDIVQGTPTLVAGRMQLDQLIEGRQLYYRFGEATIIFVDASNAFPGTGTFVNPFQTLALATAEAATRFRQSGEGQEIYVFPGDYRESLLVRATEMPGYQLKVIDSSVPLAFGGRILGGGARAAINPPGDEPAIDVADVSVFSLYGFSVSSLSVVNADRLKLAQANVGSSGATIGLNIVQVDEADIDIEANVSNSTGSGIVIKDSGGRFHFVRTSLTNAGDVGSAAFVVERLAPNAQIQFQGSITSTGGGGDLISIDTTAVSSSITFDGEDGDAITGNGAGGISVFSADGNIAMKPPVSITDAKGGFLLTGVSLFGGSGVATFGDVTISLTDNVGYNAGIEINGQTGLVSFASLKVITDDTVIGAVGLSVAFSNQVNIFGNDNFIRSNGAAAIEFIGLEMFDMTFDEITTTNTLDQAGKRNGITVSDTTSGTLNVTGKTTFSNLDGQGMFFNGAGGTFQFASMDINGAGEDGLNLGVVKSNPGTLHIASGTFEEIGGNGVRAGRVSPSTGGGTLKLNNVLMSVNAILSFRFPLKPKPKLVGESS